MEEDLPLVHKFEPFTPQPIEDRFSTKKPKKNIFAVIWKFIKKHKLVVSIMVVIIAILVALYISIPVVPVAQYRFVNEGTPVRLEMNQTAKLKYSNVSVKIDKFIENVCPTGKCFGSGPIVDYDFRIDGQKYVDTSLTPNVLVYRYQIKTVKTDNKTYAEIKILKTE
jgi:hypothetical protein